MGLKDSLRSRGGVGPWWRGGWRRWGECCGLTLTLLVSALCQGTQAYYVKFAAEITANTPGFPFNCCFENINTGNLVGVIYFLQPPVSIFDSNSFGDASVSIQGEAHAGNLKVFATGNASQVVGGDQSYFRVASASFNGGSPEFGDTVTITKDGTFTFSAELKSEVSGGPMSSGTGTTEPGVDCGLSRAHLFYRINPPPPNSPVVIQLVDEMCDGVQAQEIRTASVAMDFKAGDQIDIVGTLAVSLFGDAAVGVSPTATIDAMNTAIFRIEPVTPGATYTSESGVLYHTPSPDTDGDGVPDDVDECPTMMGVAPYGCPTHRGDYEVPYWSIGLSELLRGIQFYNVGEYCCDALGEDGYAPGFGDRTCVPHASDYNPQDWSINLSELLRAIQFYNSGGYHPDPSSEDGFAPGL